jgi:hypothetical protein
LSKVVPFLKDDIVSLKVETLARIAVEILFRQFEYFVSLLDTFRRCRNTRSDDFSASVSRGKQNVSRTRKRLERIAGLAS